MDPILTGLLIGGGFGALKSQFSDKPAAENDRRLQSEIARWSPWTGMKPHDVKEPDMFGSIFQGATTGALLGNQFSGAGGAAEEVASEPGLAATADQVPMQSAMNPSAMPSTSPTGYPLNQSSWNWMSPSGQQPPTTYADHLYNKSIWAPQPETLLELQRLNRFGY